MTITFPDGFLWGAASAPHQVEGNNVTSDAWVMEHAKPSIYAEPSGDGVDFYNRYPDDVATVAALGLNAMRFGIEWGRIEPEPGFISQAELDHYARLIDCCLEHGITPVVTLHHFTSPRWIVSNGGWRNAETAARFADYAGRIVGAFGDRVHWWCTINEANTPRQLAGNGLLSAERLAVLNQVGGQSAALFGVSADDFCPFFPFASDDASRAVIVDAHRQAVDAIHAADSSAWAGVTLSVQEQHAEPGGEAHAAAVDEEINLSFYRDMGTVGDFVAVQNYSRIRYDANGRIAETENLSGMGLPMVPGSLAATCRQAYEVTRLPILVTEHGADLDTEHDHLRAEFIEGSLRELGVAIADGCDVRGYIHWSLHDNFEWFRGYDGHFGLLAVDRATQRRTIRPSATTLGGIARRNAI